MAATQPGLEMLEKPTGTSQSPSKVQCWSVQNGKGKDTLEQVQQRVREMMEGLEPEAEGAGMVQRFFSGMAKSPQAQGEILLVFLSSFLCVRGGINTWQSLFCVGTHFY